MRLHGGGEEGEGTVSVTFSLQYGLDDGIMLITGSDRYATKKMTCQMYIYY